MIWLRISSVFLLVSLAHCGIRQPLSRAEVEEITRSVNDKIKIHFSGEDEAENGDVEPITALPSEENSTATSESVRDLLSRLGEVHCNITENGLWDLCRPIFQRHCFQQFWRQCRPRRFEFHRFVTDATSALSRVRPSTNRIFPDDWFNRHDDRDRPNNFHFTFSITVNNETATFSSDDDNSTRTDVGNRMRVMLRGFRQILESRRERSQGSGPTSRGRGNANHGRDRPHPRTQSRHIFRQRRPHRVSSGRSSSHLHRPGYDPQRPGRLSRTKRPAKRHTEYSFSNTWYGGGMQPRRRFQNSDSFMGLAQRHHRFPQIGYGNPYNRPSFPTTRFHPLPRNRHFVFGGSRDRYPPPPSRWRNDYIRNRFSSILRGEDEEASPEENDITSDEEDSEDDEEITCEDFRNNPGDVCVEIGERTEKCEHELEGVCPEFVALRRRIEAEFGEPTESQHSSQSSSGPGGERTHRARHRHSWSSGKDDPVAIESIVIDRNGHATVSIAAFGHEDVEITLEGGDYGPESTSLVDEITKKALEYFHENDD